MAQISLDGFRYHVQLLGCGPMKVVFIHGLVVDNLSSFYFTLANPVANFAEVLLYDLRGHGKTERPASGYALQDHLTDLNRLIQHYYPNDQVVLVGNSFGGTIALAYAAQFPGKVTGIFTVDGLPPLESWGQRAIVGMSMEQDHGDAVFKHLYKAWHGIDSARKTRRLKQNADAILNQTTLIEDIKNSRSLSCDEMANISCPAMALYGKDSDILHTAELLGRSVAQMEIVEVENCGHAVMFEGTESVKSKLIAWLNCNRLGELPRSEKIA